jgi:hypothetical protein
MLLFRTVHFLGKMMYKPPDNSVGKAAVRYSEGPWFESLSGCTFFSTCDIIIINFNSSFFFRITKLVVKENNSELLLLFGCIKEHFQSRFKSGTEIRNTWHVSTIKILQPMLQHRLKINREGFCLFVVVFCNLVCYTWNFVSIYFNVLIVTA